jgi:hypothetical protein
MNKVDHKILLSTLIGITTLLAVSSPASAQLITGSTISSTTGTTSLISGSTSDSRLISGTLETATDSQTTTTATLLSSPTTIIQNTTQTTSEATLADTLNTSLQETTNTAIGTIAGASTDSQTTATVVNPTEIVPTSTSTLSSPSTLIQPNGQLNVEATINNQGVTADTNANLDLGVGSLANVNICLDGSASIGSPDSGSLANCSEKPREVPEPAYIGGLVILGAYLMTNKKKTPSLTNSPKI